MTIALYAEDLAVRRGGLTILEGVQLRLGPGLVWLGGANGSGKSTLLRALAGVLPLAAGRVEIAGADLHQEPSRARQQLGHLSDSPHLFPYLTPRELLRTSNAIRQLEPTAGESMLVEWIGASALDASIGTLSSGQRRKVALVAALVHDPAVLLLDEPTNALDAAAVDDLGRLLQRRQQQGRTIVVASHRADALSLTYDHEIRIHDRSAQLL